jgi:hypothetical protein
MIINAADGDVEGEEHQDTLMEGEEGGWQGV